MNQKVEGLNRPSSSILILYMGVALSVIKLSKSQKRTKRWWL